ncbi:MULTISPECIES: hypothetical protein [Microbacterium]|uniref:DUF3618 domain-containing protein n=1 Tax=Microbacterium wangchenii TaxID=2541726 RepID=A0ABX5SYS4_9MICO|nr:MULTISPECIES: hypothetical protein [Microbacterium]MCK6068414.1 hypothetical protein [Microbacterium sp. EYE_512]QBR89975.1 hypothetical protein E4K62_15535 [Microbacterium wangchenii]TFV85175.1 hypothetical protein E4V99_09230 [Microbacterium sp. dk485]TXK09305.1 hypothetical protein FVP99_18265 [Microbacterium wangchenii]
MSNMYGGEPAVTSTAEPQSGKVDTAKSEAGEVAGSAKAEAGHVVETAKSEAASVAGEAKTQVKDLYAQTQRELRDQAATQQQRVAEGLRSVGDELGAMAQRSENPGVATDIVSQVSTRLDGVASWIADRDPGSLLDEVKSYARRKPGTFIAVAALAGLAAGRLTRALADQASDEKSSAPQQPQSQGARVDAAPAATIGAENVTTVPPVIGGATPGAGVPAGTPVYDQVRAAGDGPGDGGGSTDVRSDTL